jgi:Uncharacterized protein conserved in bacteria
MSEMFKTRFIWLAAMILALGLLASTSVATYGLVKIKTQANTITVTGSAKKQIKSDYVTWKGTFSRQSSDLSEAYSKLEEDLDKVKVYLKHEGLTESDYTVSSINTQVNYKMLPNGYASSEVESYRLYQDIDLRSGDIDRITKISRESTKLIQDGVQFQSMAPMYFYTKIADLKVDMLALATKDARNRAQKIAENAGAKIVSLKSAKMGVFQITPINSNDVSDYGINDTSSIEKEIMSVVNCTFTSK